MASKKYKPTISKAGYDATCDQLFADLRGKYEAAKADADRPPPNPATAGAFDHVPELDSKTVARWSSTVRKYLGCKLDPELIRKGGYSSFDDFEREMKPRLRATCPEAESTVETASTAGGVT